jgi:glutathione S-transferase
MTDDLLLVLGNKNLSSWSLRPWLLLRHAGLPFRERVLPFETDGWRDAIVALSPSGRVPVLHHGDLVVWDSLAICEYVADAFPDARLWPADRAARAVARSVSAEMHSGFASMRRELSMDVVARHPRQAKSRETQDDVDRVQALWTECLARAATMRGNDAGPFLFGRFSIADAMFAPVIWRFRTYDVAVADAGRADYETMLAIPAMKEWEEAAVAEVKVLAEAASGSSATRTPDPRSAQHCFAVIFSSQRTAAVPEEYEAAASAMVELAARQPGFLGVESARGPDGFGITVSYWDSLEAIRKWKDVPAHAQIQARGRESFYERYEVRVATVERGYKFPFRGGP